MHYYHPSVGWQEISDEVIGPALERWDAEIEAFLLRKKDMNNTVYQYVVVDVQNDGEKDEKVAILDEGFIAAKDEETVKMKAAVRTAENPAVDDTQVQDTWRVFVRPF